MSRGRKERERGRKRERETLSIWKLFLVLFVSSIPPQNSRCRVAQFQAIVSREMFRLSLFLSDEKVWLLNFQRHYLCRESQVAFMNYSCESWSKIVKTDIFFFEKNLPSPRVDRVTTFLSFVPSCNLTTIGIEIFLINVLDTRANESCICVCVCVYMYIKRLVHSSSYF